MRILEESGPLPESCVVDHVALPDGRPPDRAFVRLNMIASADGGTAVAGVSGGLGNRDDHAVFAALREAADGVLVGLGTVVAEAYRVPDPPHLQLYVVADVPDVTGAPDLFASGGATLVLPDDAGAAPEGVPELRGGGHGQVDLPAVLGALAGRVLVAEGGPTLAGVLVAEGLVDEFFVTIAPRSSPAARPGWRTGPTPTPSLWNLEHGFVDDDGFLFLRYGRR